MIEMTEFRAGSLRLLVTRVEGQLFADVFVPGKDESIFSLRLDGNEETVTLLEAKSGAAYTIHEKRGKLDAPEDIPLRLVQSAICPLCHAEQKPGELARADGRCFPYCLDTLTNALTPSFLRGKKHGS